MQISFTCPTSRCRVLAKPRGCLFMQPINIRFATALTLSAITLLCACTAAPTSPATLATSVLIVQPIILTEMYCPVTGELVTIESPSAVFEVYPVYCASRADARQFASLEYSQRAKLAAEQVLAQKGIATKTCPLDGEDLTATACAVEFEGQIIGFGDRADANQFKSLKPAQKSRLIAEWKASVS